MRHLRLLPALTAVLLAVACAYPLLRLLLIPLIPALAPPQMLVARDDLLSITAALNSARIGMEAGIVALVPGFALAYIVERYDWAGARLLAGCLWLLLLTPSYLLSTGWQLLVSSPLIAAGPLYGLLYSEAGIVALLVLKGLPFACLTARTAWAMVGGEIGAALRIHVRSPWRRATILGRLMLPEAGAVFAVIFIEGIGDFGIAATLGAHLRMPLVIYGIYAALARTPIDFTHAATLSLILIALATLAVAPHQWLARHRAAPASRSRPAPPSRPSRAEALLAGGAIAALILAAFVAPGLALATRVLAAGEPSRLGTAEWLGLLHSTCYAFVTATLATLLAFALLSFGRPRLATAERVLELTMLASMAVPGIVLAAGYVVAFNGWLPLYGTPALLLLGLTVTHLPLLVRFLQTPLQGANANLADAATLHGLQRLARVERIHAPLLMRPVLWGWSLAFAGVFFELPLSSLLAPTGRTPIGVQLLMLDETLRFADEARLALAGIATCLAVVGVMAGLLPWWLSRPRPHSLSHEVLPA